MSQSAVIYGFEGLALTADEISFFREINPWGYIVFARNIETPDQVLRLTDSLRDLSGRANLPILVDQEGGRVARFKEPHWKKTPPAEVFGKLYQVNPEDGLEAVRLNSRYMAHQLKSVGVTVNCLPMLDVRAADSNDWVIGDRAYGENPQAIASLGRAAAEGLMDGGMLPVIKHLPGHGRARVDSHESLPVVEANLADLEGLDFKPFHQLRDLPVAMTGHLVFTGIDHDLPSTLSPKVVENVIRSDAPGRIGFDGLLLTDDISMGALTQSYEERARLALAAGCDILLHCNGDRTEMEAIASRTPKLAGKSQIRAEKAVNAFGNPDDFDPERGWNRLQELVMTN